MSKLIITFYMNCLCVILLGYVALNRGFAYIGVAPLFVGEMVMLGGLALWLKQPVVAPLVSKVSPWLLVALMAWFGIRTVPFLEQYGLNAVRDYMIVGYGVFAFIISGLLISEPGRLVWLLRRYRTFCYVSLLLLPVFRIVVILAGGEANLPVHPGTNIAIISLRQGPVMVHLAGITAFFACEKVRSWFWSGMVALNIMLAISNRGGLLSFSLAFIIVMATRPRSCGFGRLFALVAVGFALLAVLGIEFETDSGLGIQQNRKLSVSSLVEQVTGIWGSSRESNFDDTKRWRLEWWRTIIDYTVYGDHFFGGKGFGINLAESDGFALEEGVSSLRSPHNSHMTILARSGVVGFGLWCALSIAWATEIAAHYVRAERRGEQPWADLFLFLFVYWLAHTILTTFDVFLEGPMGGIWFWIIVGVGWSSTWIYRRHPEVLLGGASGP